MLANTPFRCPWRERTTSLAASPPGSAKRQRLLAVMPGWSHRDWLNSRDVVLDRSRREKEGFGNLLITVTAGQECHDVDFACSQSHHVGTGGGARSPRNTPGAQPAQTAAYECRGWLSAKPFKRGERGT